MRLDSLTKWQKLIEKGILDYALEITNSPYGMIGKVNEAGKYNTLTYSSQTMDDCAYQPEKAMKLSTGMVIRKVWGVPMLTGKPLLCNDIQKHPESGGFPKEGKHVPLKAFMGVPFKNGKEVVGMIAVAKSEGEYTEEDMKYLKIIADNVCKSNGFDNGK